MKTTLIVATTLDGYIGQAKNQISTAWTSRADRKFFADLSKKIGLMVMGSTTYETMGKPLPGRVSIVYTKEATLLLKNNVEQLPVLATEVKNGEVMISDWIKRRGLDQEPFYTNIDPDELCTLIAQKEYENLAICGGSGIYQLFLEKKVIDEIQMTVEPVFFGGGVKLFGEKGLSEMKKMRLMKNELLPGSETMLLVLN